MRVALVNPAWSYDDSIYFGCRSAHLPLEFGYTRAFLDREGVESRIFDGQLQGADNAQLAKEVAAFAPDMTVVATAPTYLFWRCAQPELRVPALFLQHLDGQGGITVAVGPHGSVTPGATLAKLGCDVVVRGECEEVIVRLAAENGQPQKVQSTAWRDTSGETVINGAPAASRFVDHPALDWPQAWLDRHHHHHHRFDAEPDGPGAEVEASRGCPYSCTFCAKNEFRDKYRRRDLPTLMREIDGLIAKGVTYLYFIDEIFLPQAPLLAELEKRDIAFGVQTRIDLWPAEMITKLGQAGCVSVEAGVESLTPEGRDILNKKCRLTTDELAERLEIAGQSIPFVQANLIETAADDPAQVTAWREDMRRKGIWANDPVPLYPYPSSPDYRRLWGAPDDHAWERAHSHYLKAFRAFSDIQEEMPAPLPTLEAGCCDR